MKRTLLNVGAILAAFLIGLAINNACADSLENMSDSELRDLVTQLQKEVNNLKQKVAELEGRFNNSGGSTPSLSYGFDVDGLHFNNAGVVENPIDYYKTSGYTISNGVRTESAPTSTQYEYDSKGRLLRYGTVTYSYSGKTVTWTSLYKAENYESSSTYEYHYK